MTFASIFFDFNLPNATTWFYFSALLAVAFYFKFSRLFSVRNLDVATLFLLMPGFLLLQQAKTADHPLTLRWFGYVWLLAGSGYFFVRCLLDLVLVRRPALAPNLTLGGLAWLAVTLSIFLVSVALRQGPAEPDPVGKSSAALAEIKRPIEDLVHHQTAPAGIDSRRCVERGLALTCQLGVLLGLIFVGCRHFHDVHTGMAAATFYLLLPYTALHVGQWQHALPTALLLWALYAYRRPTVAGLLLGLAAGTVYFPAFLAPLWAGFYWRRGVGRFLAVFLLAALLSLTVTGTLFSLPHELAEWQPWKPPSTDSFWLWFDGTGVHWVYRIPVFVAFLAFVGLTAVWPAPKNLAHLIALSAAVLVGIQFWYADQGGVYVLWYSPLLLLMAFRPNLSDRRPPLINPETDWLSQLGQRFGKFILRQLGVEEPAIPVRG
jgi:hypothetical protein